jgi:NADPH-dependent glutamate synthase beta subunit-like oxidoreductase
MGKPRGSSRSRAPRRPPARSPSGVQDWPRSTCRIRSEELSGRPRAAWTAASRSATGLPARQPDSRLERPGLPRPLAARRSSGCTRPTTSPSSPGRSARRRARARACSASTTTRSRSRRSSWRSSTARSTRAGSCRSRRPRRTWKKVAVVGSGPAGLAAAAAAQPRRAQRDGVRAADRIGGLLRYGIPEFKMEKRCSTGASSCWRPRGRGVPHRRDVGRRRVGRELRREFDAVVLAGGAGSPRDLTVPGRELAGIHFAMEYLTQQNRRCEGDAIPDGEPSRPRASTWSSSAAATPAPTAWAPRTGRARVGAPARAAAAPPRDARRRQPVAAVAEHLPRVVGARGGRRARLRRRRPRTSPATTAGRVTRCTAVTVSAGCSDGRGRSSPCPAASSRCDADLVLLAMGFVGPEKGRLLDDLGVR